MSEATEAPRPSRIVKIRKYIDEGRMVGGAYLGLRRNLEKAKDYPIPQEVLDAYEENKGTIEDLFGREKPNDLLYHGTGEFQYSGDKYKDGVTKTLRHPLDTILENGIQSHHDVWNSVKGGYSSSSLATTWPYAKVYADFHQNPDNPLKWEFGDKADWLGYVMAVTAMAHGKSYARRGIRNPRQTLEELREARRGMKTNKADGNLNRLQSWVSYVRESKPNDTTRQIFHSRSDIAGNFGAVFVVNPEGVSLAPKGPGVYEARTLDAIPPDHFLALAVPLGKVEEYRKKVFQLEYNLPVLPTEAIDYHISKFPFAELTKNRRISAKQSTAKNTPHG